jgi:hypothetical protein
MKSILLGNGINIQFGGKAYSNDFIMKRIKYRATLDSYNEVFGNKLTSSQMLGILDGFVDIANEIRKGVYDVFAKDEETILALNDFKSRYIDELTASQHIMLEDWFFVLHMFFLRNSDLADNTTSAKQGFERLILDAIYNGGKIQELYLSMPKRAKNFFADFEAIFTLNYDNNIEKLTGKNVYHLHGDFSVLSNSENPDNVQGFIRKKETKRVVVDGMEHCFCNALLDYSGRLKYKVANDFHQLLIESEKLQWNYNNDSDFSTQLQALKVLKPFEYNMIMTKIANPDLNMATEYYFDTFKEIQNELYIIGMSPNNDGHIFDIILNNKKIKKVYFFYFSKAEKLYVETHCPVDLFECKSVQELWLKLDSARPKYNCNYSVPKEIDQFIDCFNALSRDDVSKDDILNEVKQIPPFEMKRLCKLVKEDMAARNPNRGPLNEKEFIHSSASISYIALQEGILPSTLYMICIMNFKYIKE